MALDTHLTQEDEQNKKRGMIISVAIHVILLMLALLPLLTFPDPPPGQEGILVNLGLPDQGQGTENAGPVRSEEVVEQTEQEAAPPEETSQPEPEPEREVVTSDESDVSVRKEKEKERQERLERERREQEAKEQAEAEAERKRRAEEARRREEAEAADFKDEVGEFFGEGEGKGNTGTEGNQGDTDGDPNSDLLEGISTGSGRVGGGLGNRGVARTHKPQDNSQEQGMVVVKVCVDRAGNVISAEFTQRGSTAISSHLKDLAVRSAKRWRFAEGNVDKQCGTITYNFRAQ
jgi:outer membrane biosynthesis protein TonB